MTAHIPRETVEKLEATVTTDTDPTGDTVEFAFTQDDTRPSTWTAGTWSGSYSGGKATAVTPTIGGTGTGADIELAPGDWKAWVKVTDSPEVPVRPAGRVVIT